jgi:hypothetical protein
MNEDQKRIPAITLVETEVDYMYAGFKFDVNAALHLTPNILHYNPCIKRVDLFAAVFTKHLESGGLSGKTNPKNANRTALKYLIQGKQIIRLSRGIYALSDSDIAKKHRPPKRKGYARYKHHLKIEKTIGIGNESLYVYLNLNDRNLANYERRETYECKIGYSGKKDARGRILDQIGTAISRFPVVGLVIHCENSSDLESSIHKVLELAKCDYKERCGSEWFMTSTQIIEYVWKELMTNEKMHAEIANNVVKMKSIPLKRLGTIWMIIKLILFGR